MTQNKFSLRPAIFAVIWKIQRAWFRGTWRFSSDSDRFLRACRGVIHVGANMGQERDHYEKAGLKVVWIEPLPGIFAILSDNIRNHPRQRAINALATDVDGRDYEFHVADNAGLSSSIFDLKLHRDIWPQVQFTETLQLKGARLDSLMKSASLDSSDYDALVLDTQGSELLVLRGATQTLRGIRYIKTEVADFEAYEGCCTLGELEAFLATKGFSEFAREITASHPGGGRYYDIVYRRVTPVS